MNEPIVTFSGEHQFLSNFHPALVEFDGVRYPTSEHAFQAAKTPIRLQRIRIRDAATPGKAKRMGREVELRKDWEEVKVDVMRVILEDKFDRNPELRENLLATEDAQLVEGNHWHDNFWGSCTCGCGPGLNKLGELLMELRGRLRQSRCPACRGKGVVQSKPLTYGELMVGERFISFPLDGDDSGHGGFRGGGHRVFTKLHEGDAVETVHMSISKFPDSMLVLKILL